MTNCHKALTLTFTIIKSRQKTIFLSKAAKFYNIIILFSNLFAAFFICKPRRKRARNNISQDFFMMTSFSMWKCLGEAFLLFQTYFILFLNQL